MQDCMPNAESVWQEHEFGPLVNSGNGRHHTQVYMCADCGLVLARNYHDGPPYAHEANYIVEDGLYVTIPGIMGGLESFYNCAGHA